MAHAKETKHNMGEPMPNATPLLPEMEHFGDTYVAYMSTSFCGILL